MESQQKLQEHRQEYHSTDCDIERESESEERIVYRCDLCGYESSYPDNVAFHYTEDHAIKINWMEAEKKCKRLI